jgi:apolipoprotein N-acyltransferase
MTKWLMPAVATALSATALWFGTGLHPIWWVMWLAPLPILLVAPRVGAWAVIGTAAMAWFLGGLNVWGYLHRLEIPAAVVVAICMIPAIVFGVSVGLFRAFLKRGLLWRATFVTPVLWVAYEFLAAFVSPHSTFFNLGYTQMDCLPALQIVSLTGIWGISFCLFLLPATIAVLASRVASARQGMRPTGVVAVTLIAVIAFGSYRLSSTPPAESSVTVALVAADLYPANREAADKLLRDYADQVNALTAGGAQLMVLPEKIAVVSDERTGAWDDILGASAARGHATVVAGIDRGGARRRWNEARVYSATGMVEGVYDKHHMIPGLEDVDQAGSRLLVMKRPSGVWGVAICKDMDFPSLSRQYGVAGVGLLIVPAWDFGVDGWLHGRMAVMRGVESGFTIARSAKEGLLTVSDDRGRILAEKSSSGGPMAFVTATAPVRHADTFYVRYGDWFGWANVAGLLVIFISMGSRGLRFFK